MSTYNRGRQIFRCAGKGKQFNVWFPRDLILALQARCIMECVDAGDIVRTAVSSYCKYKEPRYRVFIPPDGGKNKV